MMTKEEYKENLIRMWDSVRKNECKGQITCLGVRCEDCPLNWEVCQCSSHSVDVLNVYKAIEAVENWAEQHPIVTNAEKFREVFGMEKLPFYSCIYTNADCRDCEHFIGMGCKANGDFWNAEYKGKTEGCEEE